MTRAKRRRRAKATRRGWISLGIVTLALILGLAVLHFGSRPQDLPWTRLDLSEPPGLFTPNKIAALSRDYPLCHALLREAGINYVPVAPLSEDQCGYRDAMTLAPGGARTIGFAPEHPKMACPVAAALAMWEWNSVQPAAIRHFGANVVRFEQLGTYNCRPIAGSSVLSQHSYARAIDIAGFVLSDGRRITLVDDWQAGGEKAAFLRDVRDGACAVFATTLSPDFNAAHRDHLHLDEAPNRQWRVCH